MGSGVGIDLSAYGGAPQPNSGQPQGPVGGGKGATILSAADAILGGLRKGYLNKQIQQFEGLDRNFRIAQSRVDGLQKEAEYNKQMGISPDPHWAERYQQATQDREQAWEGLQKATQGGGGKGAQANPNAPNKTATQNMGIFLKRMLFGPGLSNAPSSAPGAPPNQPGSMSAVSTNTGTPVPFNPSNPAGPSRDSFYDPSGRPILQHRPPDSGATAIPGPPPTGSGSPSLPPGVTPFNPNQSAGGAPPDALPPTSTPMPGGGQGKQPPQLQPPHQFQTTPSPGAEVTTPLNTPQTAQSAPKSGEIRQMPDGKRWMITSVDPPMGYQVDEAGNPISPTGSGGPNF